MQLSELQNKEIVNVSDGRNIGSIIDVRIDEHSGKIISFLIEPSKNFFSLFNRGKDTEIPWENISMIGEDVILVNMKNYHI